MTDRRRKARADCEDTKREALARKGNEFTSVALFDVAHFRHRRGAAQGV